MRTHEERVLVRGLGGLNADLSRFVMSALEADWQGRQWPHAAKDEAALALRMVELAHQLEQHAKGVRGSDIDGTGTAVVEGDIDTSTPPDSTEQ